MNAIRVHQFGPPEVMKLETVADPKPSAQQALVRVRAAGVNPVDTYIRSGAYAKLPALPYTPGSDAAGIVEAIGAEVRDLKIGERVYLGGTISGAYAELALCERSQIHHLAEQITFEQGAAINTPYATAYRALFQKAHAQPGETVLVHGASGGVGIAAVQLAAANGLRVIGTAGSDRGLQLVREQGAQHALDHRQPNYLEALIDMTGGQGVNIIVEMLANANLAKDLTVLAVNGHIVIIGSRGPVEINPREIMRREAVISGVFNSNASPAELSEIHTALAAGFANGSLHPLIGEKIPLAEAPRAHEALMKPGASGKIVLIP